MAQVATLRVGHVDDTYVLRLEGYGSMWESHALTSAIGACMSEGATRLAIDLSACVYLDSTFLGNLLVLHRRFDAKKDAQLFVIADEPTRRQLFGASHLDRVIPCTAELECAMPDEWVVVERNAPDCVQIGRHSAECHRELGEFGGPDADRFLRIAEQLENELQQTRR